MKNDMFGIWQDVSRGLVHFISFWHLFSRSVLKCLMHASETPALFQVTHRNR